MACIEEQQFIDPEISRRKFQRELSLFKEQEQVHKRKGFFLLSDTFPRMMFLVTAPQLSPPPILYGLQVDFTNYDTRPPSVKLVDPYSGKPCLAKEIRSQIIRLVPPEDGASGPPLESHLLQSHGPDQEPFLCLPGVLEYHNHPTHTGDPWHLHKAQGTLASILDKIWLYGVKSLHAYHAQIPLQLSMPVLTLRHGKDLLSQ
jgi:hypothetical protein